MKTGKAIRLLAACAVFVAGWAAALPALAQPADAASERQIKAAFLVRFTEYVQWPTGTFPRKDSPLVIGVLADNGIGADVQSLTAGRAVQGRPLSVRVLKERDAIAGVHVLFVGEGANAQLRQITRSVEGPVLVVTEAEDGLERGAVINFVVVERRVRFEVALGAASARNLALGSGLLSVALNVRKDSGLVPAMYALYTNSGKTIGRKLAPVAGFRYRIL